MILEINGTVVDLPATTKGLIRLQQSLAALSSLETRSGEYSWSLSLPATRRNAGIFARACHAQTLDKFSRSYTFRLRSGSQQWAGAFLLTSLKNGYTGNLQSDGFGWAAALGEKTLPQLTTLAPVEYDGSQLADILALDCDTTDLQFPLVAYGNFFCPPSITAEGEEVPALANSVIEYPLSISDWPPSCYAVNVLRACFREAGYHLQGAVLSDAHVREWVVTAAGSGGDFWPWGSLLPARSRATQMQQAFSYFDAPGGKGYSNTALAFDEDAHGEIFYLPVPVPEALIAPTRALAGRDATYTAPRAGSYTFEWSTTISSANQELAYLDQNAAPAPDVLAGFHAVGLGLVVCRGGEGFAGADSGICTNGVLQSDQQRLVGTVYRLDQGTILIAGSFAAAAEGVYLEAGDTVSVCVFARRRLLNDEGEGQLARRVFELTFSAATFACTAYEDNDGLCATTINPAAVLPAMSQRDFIRDFLVRTNQIAVSDPDRRTVTLLSRPAHTAALGEAVDITEYVDPASLEYLPAVGGAASVVFSAAEGGDDVVALKDEVRVSLPGGRTGSEKAVTGSFAATGQRLYGRGPIGFYLPTCASQAALDTPRSEVNGVDVKSAAPRLLLYQGPDAAVPIPFGTTTVPLGRAAYTGSVTWAGEGGAVDLHYQQLLDDAARGHVLRCSVALTPARYKNLAPGRAVWLSGAGYIVASVSNYDPGEGSCLASVELERVV